MATHKLAILVEAIGAAKAAKDLKGVDKTIGSIGARSGKGLRTAASNLAGVGAIAVGGIALAVKTGLDDLATLETAVTSVDGAIKRMGLTGKVTGTEVATWANQIEAATGAAFDDKDITAATATLIRYGKVTQANLRPAMVVMTDLAAKTGSVESASTLLAKALADPAKAAGKLARQGIILTKEQQKQIRAALKVNDVGKAQAIILATVAKQTKGAAEASQGPYQRAMSTLKDASEDARKALAVGFLPVIQKVADLLSKELAKPETLNNIKEFGTTLADGLDSLISIAKNLPWAAIGTSLKVGGQGAKIVLDAFNSMPPWIQTAVATGWGLNKLTGGAISDIVGELGKGLIKGVLGMNAGVVNINAATVNGLPGGGVPGAAGAAGGGVAGIVSAVVPAAVAVGVGAGMKEGWKQVSVSLFPPQYAQMTQDVLRVVNPLVGVASFVEELPQNLSDLASAIKGIGKPSTPTGSLTGHGGPGRNTQGSGTGSLTGHGGPGRGGTDPAKSIADLQHNAVSAIDKTTAETRDSKTKTGEKLGSIDRTALTAGQTVASATTSGAAGINSTMVGNTGRIVGAIAAAKPVITTTVIVNVSGSTVTSSQTTQSRTGSSGGSRSNDDYNGAGHGKS